MEEKAVKGKAVEEEAVRNWKKYYGIKKNKKSHILKWLFNRVVDFVTGFVKNTTVSTVVGEECLTRG